MTDLFYSLLPILGVQLAAVLATLFVFIHSQGRNVIRLLVIPLSLAGLFAAPFFFVQAMGYAVHWPLPNEFVFIAYRPVVKSGLKTDFEIWVRDGSSTRLYRAPYSKQMEQMLHDAAKGVKGGRQARIKRKGERWWPGDDNRPPDGGYELRLETPMIPKGGEPPQQAPQQTPEQEPDEPITKRYSI